MDIDKGIAHYQKLIDKKVKEALEKAVTERKDELRGDLSDEDITWIE